MDLNQKIPAYLISKRNIVRLIIFTAGFALLFINIYSPFDVRNWFGLNLKSQELFFYSSLIILTGVLVAVISRLLLYYYNRKVIRTKIWAFLLIIGVEVIFMSLFYTVYESVFIKTDNREFIEVFKVSLQNTALVLLLPYAVLWLYFSWQDKTNKLKELTESEEVKSTERKRMIPFLDEKGTMRITLKIEDVLYLKGADNYVSIYYKGKNAVSKFLLRNTLKNVEYQLEDLPVTRCHRSYMVNFEKVKIVRRDKGVHLLEMDTDPPIEVPLSKTYMQRVFQLFGNI